MGSYIRKTLAIVLMSAVFGLALRADASTEADSAAEWSGEYWFSAPNPTMTMTLVITPESRFKLTMGGCFGSDEINHGSVTYRDGVVLLNPHNLDAHALGYESNAMIPVRWDDRLYLVGANRIMEFARAVKGDPERCRDHCQGFFVRESDLL